MRRGPRVADVLLQMLAAVDRAFERIYTSRYNPLQESGPLAVALLLIVGITGVWLLLFYRLNAPFASVQYIAAHPILTGWVRALHRYASDAALVAVVLHVLRLLAEGRAHGQRVLGWVSGVVLVLFVMVCGWTGFVLVWDDQARAVALEGARLLESIPLLRDILSMPFLMPAPLGSSFFFMNLFLHMALPLGMFFGLWLHTLRLQRVRWLPHRRLLIASSAALTLLSLVAPPALGPAADGASLVGPSSFDLFYNGWLLLTERLPAWLGLASVAALTGLLALVPRYWRPRAAALPRPAENDKSRCEGCTQCVQDCPFGAISMIPGAKEGALVADVDASLCTSCGLCAGSCEQLVIAPPDRAPRLQLATMRALRRDAPAEAAVVVLHCKNARHDLRALGGDARVVAYALECTGSVHPAAVTNLLHHFKGVFIASCPPQACQMRFGPALTASRMHGGQRPSRLGEEAGRVQVVHVGGGERAELAAAFAAFASKLGLREAPRPARHVRAARLAAVGACTAVLLGALAAVGARPLDTSAGADASALRLAWRVPGQSLQRCRDLSPEELASRPAHMRRARECEIVGVEHTLNVHLDGRPALERVISPRGRRGDGPMVVNLELPIAPGTHEIRVTLAHSGGAAEPLVFAAPLAFEAGRARVMTYDNVSRALVVLEPNPNQGTPR